MKSTWPCPGRSRNCRRPVWRHLPKDCSRTKVILAYAEQAVHHQHECRVGAPRTAAKKSRSGRQRAAKANHGARREVLRSETESEGWCWRQSLGTSRDQLAHGGQRYTGTLFCKRDRRPNRWHAACKWARALPGGEELSAICLGSHSGRYPLVYRTAQTRQRHPPQCTQIPPQNPLALLWQVFSRIWGECITRVFAVAKNDHHRDAHSIALFFR